MSRVYTIGYEATDIASFVSTLHTAGVECLIDVRAVAHSRKRGFSKNALADRLGRENISYIHLIALGDPKPGREAARAGRYDVFEKIYRSHLATEEAEEALQEAVRVALAQPSCLMCFERDPSLCHRSIVANALSLPAKKIVDLYATLPRHYGHLQKQSCHTGQSIAAAE